MWTSTYALTWNIIFSKVEPNISFGIGCLILSIKDFIFWSTNEWRVVEKHGIFGNFILENNLVEHSHNETFVWPNILDGMIDQLRRGGGRLVSALNLIPGFLCPSIKLYCVWILSKLSKNDTTTIETLKARNDIRHSTDGPYLVSRDKTEPLMN